MLQGSSGSGNKFTDRSRNGKKSCMIIAGMLLYLIFMVCLKQRSESSWEHSFYYLHQGGYVFVVCLLATLLKNFQTDLPEIFRKGWQWASEQMIQF